MYSAVGRILKIHSAFLCFLLLISCSTPAVKNEISEFEEVRRDRDFGNELANRIEPRLDFKSDLEVTVFLRKIGLMLWEKTATLAEAPLGVFIVGDMDGRWATHSLPGNRIYVNVNLLKAMEFENEMAAAIAFEGALLARRTLVLRLASRFDQTVSEKDGGESSADEIRIPESFKLIGPEGIFKLENTELLDAIPLAVQLLYSSAYDPRGLTTYFQILHKNIDKSPYSDEFLTLAMEKSRIETARLNPIRNPIVRTEAFLDIKKKISKL